MPGNRVSAQVQFSGVDLDIAVVIGAAGSRQHENVGLVDVVVDGGTRGDRLTLQFL